MSYQKFPASSIKNGGRYDFDKSCWLPFTFVEASSRGLYVESNLIEGVQSLLVHTASALFTH